MRVLAVGFVAYVAVLFSTSLVAIYLLRPIAAGLTTRPAEAFATSAPVESTPSDWHTALAHSLDALRGRAATELPVAAPQAPAAVAPQALALAEAVRVADATVGASTVELVAPAESAPPPSPPERTTDASAEPAPSASTRPPEIAILLQRGDALLATGDLAAARLFYMRAAEHGDRAAASGVAKTYDPLFLEQAGFRHLPGDPALATTWYRQAVDAGDADAAHRLEQLMTRGPVRSARQ